MGHGVISHTTNQTMEDNITTILFIKMWKSRANGNLLESGTVKINHVLWAWFNGVDVVSGLPHEVAVLELAMPLVRVEIQIQIIIVIL